VARLLLKGGLTWKEFAEIAKAAFVQVATEEFGIRGRPTNVSRVAILTGIGRREVRKQREALERVEAGPVYLNAATRVLAAWHQDPNFVEASGGPSVLAVSNKDGPSFEELCKGYAGDVPTGALLKELRAVGAIEDAGSGRLRVLQRNYIPLQVDAEKTLRAGGVYEDFGNTVVHDLICGEREPLRFERRASNAQVDAKDVAEFRLLLEREGQAMLERIDAWLTAHEVPEGQRNTRRTVRLGVGVYHIQDALNGQTRR